MGIGDGQGGLACCSPWGRKESDTTERLNWTELSEQKGWVEAPGKEWVAVHIRTWSLDTRTRSSQSCLSHWEEAENTEKIKGSRFLQVSTPLFLGLIQLSNAGSPLLRLMMRTGEQWARNQDSSMPCNLLALGHKVGYSLCHPGFLHLWMWAIYTSLTGVKGEDREDLSSPGGTVSIYCIVHGWLNSCVHFPGNYELSFEGRNQDLLIFTSWEPGMW